MNEGYRIERSGQRHWRIVRADGTTLPAWEYRSRLAAQRRLDDVHAGALDAEWAREHAAYQTPLAAYDEDEE